MAIVRRGASGGVTTTCRLNRVLKRIEQKKRAKRRRAPSRNK